MYEIMFFKLKGVSDKNFNPIGPDNMDADYESSLRTDGFSVRLFNSVSDLGVST